MKLVPSSVADVISFEIVTSSEKFHKYHYFAVLVMFSLVLGFKIMSKASRM